MSIFEKLARSLGRSTGKLIGKAKEHGLDEKAEVIVQKAKDTMGELARAYEEGRSEEAPQEPSESADASAAEEATPASAEDASPEDASTEDAQAEGGDGTEERDDEDANRPDG